MIDWVQPYLSVKANIAELHNAMLKKDHQRAIDLALEIAADARLCANQIRLQHDENVRESA